MESLPIVEVDRLRNKLGRSRLDFPESHKVFALSCVIEFGRAQSV